jgi:hypothetical protein
MNAFDVQSMTARTRDVVRPQLRPERMPRQLAGALGTRAVAAAHPAVLGQLADQPREGGTENLAHLSLLASRERSVDEFVDYPASTSRGSGRGRKARRKSAAIAFASLPLGIYRPITGRVIRRDV